MKIRSYYLHADYDHSLCYDDFSVVVYSSGLHQVLVDLGNRHGISNLTFIQSTVDWQVYLV